MFILEQEQNKTTKKLHKSDLLFIYTFVFGLRNDDLMEVPPALKKNVPKVQKNYFSCLLKSRSRFFDRSEFPPAGNCFLRLLPMFGGSVAGAG